MLLTGCRNRFLQLRLNMRHLIIHLRGTEMLTCHSGRRQTISQTQGNLRNLRKSRYPFRIRNNNNIKLVAVLQMMMAMFRLPPSVQPRWSWEFWDLLPVSEPF